MIDTLELDKSQVAVLIPCYNEESTVAKVVQDFKKILPQAEIYVFDNNSTDNTAAWATEAGATVIKEKKQGKGYVVAAMLAKIDADLYVLVDGDDTYPAEKAVDLLMPLLRQEADMIVGQRLSEYSTEAFRPLHILGNKLVCVLINAIFSAELTDVMSGFRAFSREIADNLPIVATGFDVETEMTLQALYRGYIIKEIPIFYRERQKGSVSKLRTFEDGARVLLKIVGIVTAYKPLTCFGGLGILMFLVSLVSGLLITQQYLQDKYIQNLPLFFLSLVCLLLSVVLISIGLIVHSVNFRILEIMHVSSKQNRRISSK